MTETKEVTYKRLKKGQTIQGTVRGNCSSSFTATVEDVNAAYVSVLMWGERPEKIPSEETMFRIELSEEEFRKKYKKEAIEVIRGLSNTLIDTEIGYHEMWNGWVHYDPFEMGKDCRKHNIKILGICENVWQKGIDRDRDRDRDVGICAEDEAGDKFWCHAAGHYIKRMLNKFKYLIS